VRAALVTILLLGPALAQAHARPAVLNRVRVDRRDPSHVVAQATWGLAVSRDGGDRWRWSCAAVIGTDPRFEDPVTLIGFEGRVLMATFSGLFVSDPDGCEWALADGPVGERWVIDLVRDPSDPERLYAVTTDVLASDQLFVSEDEGRTWTARGEASEEYLLQSLLVAPSAPERVYLSADIPGLPEDRRTLVLRSDDGGRTLTPIEFEGLVGDERLLRIAAVDPTDADVLYARVVETGGAAIDPSRLVRSEDGGETWATVLEQTMLGDVVVSGDGATVWTASRAGGVFRSDDGGRTFAEAHPDLPVTCLSLRDGELEACTDDAMAGFALATSTDRGATWTPRLELAAIDEMVECPPCSGVGVACPSWLPDVSYDLGFDAGLDVEIEPDGGIGLPRDAGLPPECGGPPPPSPSCGCRVVGPRGSPLGWAGLALIAWTRRRGARARRGPGGRARGGARARSGDAAGGGTVGRHSARAPRRRPPRA